MASRAALLLALVACVRGFQAGPGGLCRRVSGAPGAAGGRPRPWGLCGARDKFVPGHACMCAGGGGTATLERAAPPGARRLVPWDQEETARFRAALVRAARARQGPGPVRTARGGEFAPRPAARRGVAPEPRPAAQDGEEPAELVWSRLPGFSTWLALVKRATRAGYEDDGTTPRPRPQGFRGGAAADDGADEELSALGRWQRTDGPFYVQFAGAFLLLTGFLNHIALNNQNGSGVEGLSQPLFAASILVVMLGLALERQKSPRE